MAMVVGVFALLIVPPEQIPEQMRGHLEPVNQTLDATARYLSRLFNGV